MTFFQVPQSQTPVIRTVQALLLHETRASEGFPQSHWLTTHPVEQQEHGPLIGPGTLLSEEDKRALIEALLGTLSPEEFKLLPPHVLAIGAAKIAWYVPGRCRPMHFNMNRRRFSVRVPWPTLIFRVVDGQVWLAALASAERPSGNTPLYHAPVLNVNSATHVCTGTAILPPGSGLDDCAAYERAIYETNFSHVNHRHTLAGAADVSDDDHVRFWRRLAKTKAAIFPAESLVPLDTTVGAWLAAGTGARRRT